MLRVSISLYSKAIGEDYIPIANHSNIVLRICHFQLNAVCLKIIDFDKGKKLFNDMFLGKLKYNMIHKLYNMADGHAYDAPRTHA